MRKIKLLTPVILITLLLGVTIAGCTQSAPTSPAATPSPTVNLNGAGATFPNPLYAKWFDEYYKITGIKINYQPIGSGGGISQITQGTVDFGASDGIMTAEQLAKAEAAHGPILHIPMTSGAVAVIYNLAGISSGQLKLTGDVLADIYQKKITRWNNPRLTASNPGLNLPDEPIAVVHRSDGSGTTFIFTNYLSKVSPDWSTEVGNATSVNWPGDIGGQGNAGVAGQVKQIAGSIGYVELAYARQNSIAWAQLMNLGGKYIEPSLAATTKAAEGVTLPDDMKVMITNSSSPDAYPITGFTWILAYANQTDKAKGETLVKMLWWAIHEGQQYTQPLDYAPLSSTAVTKAENQVLSIIYQGQPLLSR
ncbi:MAG: phosphate ABC transporter substrate-binding protein PstS [Chloroflexi bacterium RBG_16_50_9]|nr:MAG: phosphate ABC transporter substrate-binding protein PstS [Chloroflexi bacterium RBG_16_50_9]